MTTLSTFPWSSNRVNRGGSWNNNATNCRVANRNNNSPSNRNNNLGFRLAPQLSRECRTQFNGRTGNVGLTEDKAPQRINRGTCFPQQRMASSSLSLRRKMPCANCLFVLNQDKPLLAIKRKLMIGRDKRNSACQSMRDNQMVKGVFVILKGVNAQRKQCTHHVKVCRKNINSKGVSDIKYKRIGRRPTPSFKVFLPLLDNNFTNAFNTHAQRIIHVKNDVLNMAGESSSVTNHEEKDIRVQHVSHDCSVKSKVWRKNDTALAFIHCNLAFASLPCTCARNVLQEKVVDILQGIHKSAEICVRCKCSE